MKFLKHKQTQMTRWQLQKRKARKHLIQGRAFVLVGIIGLGGLLVSIWHLSALTGQTPFLATYNPVQESLAAELPTTTPMTIQDHVAKIMTEEFSLTLEEQTKFFMVIQCESAWDPYAINKNTDGSLDLGLAQINEKWHGKNITREQSFDVYANTRYAMKLYKEQGFTPWTCAKKLGIK